MKGIEIELLNEYVNWLKKKKNMNVQIRYTSYATFGDFYASFSRSTRPNRIGLGSVTITSQRLKEIDFTNGYMKDVAFCVTNGHSPDVKTKNPAEITRALGSMSAITMSNTSLNNYVLDLRKDYLKDLRIQYVPDESKILDEVAKNVLSFGYVNAVTFWFYLKNNPTRFLKMQKVLSQSKDELALALPKGSPHKALFAEFFAGPGGFKTTSAYRAILEKYLGSYMTQNIAVN